MENQILAITDGTKPATKRTRTEGTSSNDPFPRVRQHTSFHGTSIRPSTPAPAISQHIDAQIAVFLTSIQRDIIKSRSGIARLHQRIVQLNNFLTTDTLPADLRFSVQPSGQYPKFLDGVAVSALHAKEAQLILDCKKQILTARIDMLSSEKDRLSSQLTDKDSEAFIVTQLQEKFPSLEQSTIQYYARHAETYSPAVINLASSPSETPERAKGGEQKMDEDGNEKKGPSPLSGLTESPPDDKATSKILATLASLQKEMKEINKKVKGIEIKNRNVQSDKSRSRSGRSRSHSGSDSADMWGSRQSSKERWHRATDQEKRRIAGYTRVKTYVRDGVRRPNPRGPGPFVLPEWYPKRTAEPSTWKRPQSSSRPPSDHNRSTRSDKDDAPARDNRKGNRKRDPPKRK